MNQEHVDTLREVGLSEKQARAYLALLELERGSAASVALKAGLKTPTAYVVLKELIEKGFVQRMPRAKKQLFIAEPPAAAFAAIEGRVNGFKDILPSLAALTKRARRSKARTLFFEGKAGMRSCYDYRIDELKNEEYVAFFASAEDLDPDLSEALLEWSKKMAKANISSRAIVPDHPSLNAWRDRDSAFKRTVKVVPKDTYSAKSSVEVFPEFVRIAMYKNMQGIIIDDAEIARAFKEIFEMAWSGAPKA